MTQLPENIIDKLENFPSIKLTPFKKNTTPLSMVGPSRYTNVPRNFVPDVVNQKDSQDVIAAARSVSTYPTKAGMCIGDPICDCFYFRDFENRTLFCLVDGCSTGNRTKDASDTACFAFVESLTEAQQKAKDVKSLGLAIVKAIYKAHEDIIKANNSEHTTESGSCFLSGGVVAQIKSEKSAQKWVFICGILGNVKVFHLPKGNSKPHDLSREPSRRLVDTILSTESLGRVGGALDLKDPDMKGFRLLCVPCTSEDQFFLATQGLWANHLPEVQGKSPIDSLLDFPSWRDVSYEDVEEHFIHSLSSIWKDTKEKDGSWNLTTVVAKHIETIFQLTDTRRSDPRSLSSNVATSWDKYPGVLDHVSALLFRVGATLKATPTTIPPKPLPTRAASQRISRQEVLAAKPVAKLIETEWILDKCLQQMMNHYYSHLRLEPNMSRVEALKLAQLEIRELYPTPSYRFGENFLPNEDILGVPNIKMHFWKSTGSNISYGTSSSLYHSPSPSNSPFYSMTPHDEDDFHQTGDFDDDERNESEEEEEEEGDEEDSSSVTSSASIGSKISPAQSAHLRTHRKSSSLSLSSNSLSTTFIISSPTSSTNPPTPISYSSSGDSSSSSPSSSTSSPSLPAQTTKKPKPKQPGSTKRDSVDGGSMVEKKKAGARVILDPKETRKSNRLSSLFGLN